MEEDAVDEYYDREAGPVWRELRNGLWHCTGSHRFRRILKSGEISPKPNLGDGEFIWGSQGTTHCRWMNGVSLFDFADADWTQVFENRHQDLWLQFIGGAVPYSDPNAWVSTVWIAIGREQLTGLATHREVSAIAKANRFPGNRFPWLEACHKGPISISACPYVVAVCSADTKEFRQLSLHPFNAAEFEKVEKDWRARFADFYESRARPAEEQRADMVKRIASAIGDQARVNGGEDISEELEKRRRRALRRDDDLME